MNKFDEMSAEEIREYLEKGKCSREEAQDIYNHEMNGEMRAEALEAIRNYMAGLGKPTKKAAAKETPVKKKG